MKPEIKEIISQIQNGIVPKGYKKTVVGIVPEEWEETSLSELFTFKNGLNKEKEAFGKGTPIINYTDVWKKRGIRAASVEGKVELSEKEIENYNVQKGDVFFTRTSETRDEIGLSSVLLDDIDNAVFSGFVLRARPINDRVETRYHQYCYSSPLMRHEIIRKSSITTRALTSGVSLGQVAINLPSKSEQKRIADILEKWDKAIELQEQLIEKMETHKASLLQNLFVPNKLWNYRLLGDICKISTGKLDANASEENGEYPFFTCAKDILKINKYAFDCEALLVAGNGDIGDIKYYNGKFNAYQRTYVLYNFEIPIKYVYYYLQKNFDKEVLLGTQKSSMPYIKLETLKKTKIKCDNDIYKKVESLEKMDKLLYLAKEKRKYILEQQKSMQQLLLTGIVRV